MRFLNRSASLTMTILSVLTTALLAAMVVNIFLLVVLRYVFSYSFPWSEELTRYLMIWMGLLGTSVLIRKREHIRLKFIIDSLPALASGILDIFFYLIEIAFLILLIQKSWVWAISMRNVTAPALQISMIWPAISIPISAIFMLFYSILNTIEDFKTLLKGRSKRKSPMDVQGEVVK